MNLGIKEMLCKNTWNTNLTAWAVALGVPMVNNGELHGLVWPKT